MGSEEHKGVNFFGIPLQISAAAMRNKKRTATAVVSTGAPPEADGNPLPLSGQNQTCFEGESLARFLKSIRREIESARASDATLPYKFWIKQQFAVGVNEVTRVLERMPSRRDSKISPNEHFPANSGHLQVILLASDCNPRWLTKHLPTLAASRNVPLISVKDRKEGSLRLGELIKLKTAIAVGIKAKGNAVNRLIDDHFIDKDTDPTEA